MDEAVQKKIRQLEDSLKDFQNALHIDLSEIQNPILQDTIKSGQIQKFEMTVELLWKTLKKYLLEVNGIDVLSPKTVMKSWFENGYCTYEEYEILIGLINNRNKLSHTYNKEDYLKIHETLPQSFDVMQAQLKGMRK